MTAVVMIAKFKAGAAVAPAGGPVAGQRVHLDVSFKAKV